MVENVVSSVLGKLADNAFGKLSSIGGVGQQVEKLKRELRWIQAFLKDADRKTIRDEGQKHWVKEVRELAYDIEDVIDNALLSEIEAPQESTSKVGAIMRVLKKPRKVPALDRLADEIEVILERIEEISNSRIKYGIKDLGEGNEGDNLMLPLKPTLLPDIDDPNVIGFDTHRDHIVKELLDENTRKRSVVSIVGVGGLGKTTLAQKAYNSADVKASFSRRLWVTVSQKFELIDILRKILEQIRDITSSEQGKETEYFLAELHKSFQEQKYLLVLDDVWTDELWGHIEEVMIDSNNGSRVLITSRNKNVAKVADPSLKPYKLPVLSEDQGLQLLLQKAIRGRPYCITAYAAEDILIGFEFMFDGGKDEASGSAEVGHKRKISEVTGSEISLSVTVEHLTNFTCNIEQVGSNFNSLLIEHAQTFTYLRAVGQRVTQQNLPKEQAPRGREVEWKQLVSLLLQCSSDCSSTDIAVEPKVGTGKTALTESPSQGSNERNVTAICIIGPSGVGKTVFVHSVYNNCVVSEAFDLRLWVFMSEKTNEISLLIDMIESITSQPCDIFEHSMLQEILRDEMTNKKFLLVLDGAENENEDLLRSVLTFLEIGAKGSFVLVSTSNREVAIAIASKNNFYLDPLSMKSSWLVFLHSSVLPIIGFSLRKTSKQLIARCQGFPLCIKMLSKVLCCSDNEEWFQAVSHNRLWDIAELGGTILPTIRVCYDLLPIHLKRCLKYCSLFPKNFILKKKHVVLLWISQGFIEHTIGKELEDIGAQYFDDLLGRSFFEKSPFHNAKDDKFMMHELIHLLVQHVSREEYFRFGDCLNSASSTVKHFSIAHGDEYDTEEISVVAKVVSDFQTFYFVNRSSTSQWNSGTPISHLMALHDLIAKFTNLRTLNLSGTDIEALPEGIQYLGNLHYLGLSATKILALPLWMSKLVNLQTLEAQQCSRLVELPKSITEMSNLRHLDVRKEYGFVGMPCGIGHLTNLQTLSIINVGDGVSQCSIGEMKNLKFLRGSLQIAGLENVGSRNDAMEAAFISKRFLQSVTLHWDKNKVHYKCDEGVASEVFKGLILNYNLEELIIRNYPGMQFPKWVEDSNFSKLDSVIIDNCFKITSFPSLGELPSLRYLSVRNMYGVRKLGVTKGFDWRTLPSFPSLEFLNLHEMHGLEDLFEIENGDFPCLHTLSISRCLMLKNIPCFPSLLELSIHLSNRIPDISQLPSLEILKIEGFRKTQSLNLPQNLTRLKKLEIKRCNELVSVVGIWCLASLKDLKVIECPQLVIDRRQEKQLTKKENTWTNSEGQEMGSAGVLLDEKTSSSMINTGFYTALAQKSFNDVPAKARWKKTCSVIVFVTRLQNMMTKRRINDDGAWQQKMSDNVVETLDNKAEFDLLTGLSSDKGEDVLGGTVYRAQLHNTRDDRESQNKELSVAAVNSFQLVMPEDGYGWRKYGQKYIRNIEKIRSYFRCKNQSCNAKKKVEWHPSRPTDLKIVYDGNHDHNKNHDSDEGTSIPPVAYRKWCPGMRS